MNQAEIVGLAVGSAFVVLGFLLTTRESVARWGLTHGRGGFWVAILGMERAVKVTRYVFGPLVLIIGLLALLAGVIGVERQAADRVVPIQQR